MFLEAGRCYNFVGEGDGSVRGVYLYLWGPRGHRLRDTRASTPHASMSFCTVAPGQYHVQAKVAGGNGDYRLGIFTR
jgi:hypothetical protein